MLSRLSRSSRARFIVPVAILAAGCASLSLKQKATLGLQSAHTAVGAAQDTERSLYAAKAADLTPVRHGQFASFFERYFTAEEKVAVALLAWRAGDPVPPDLPAAMAALREALSTANTLTDGADRSSLLGKINDGIAAVQRILDIVGGVQ